MLKIRRSWDRVTYNMEIPISGKNFLYIKVEPCKFTKGSVFGNVCDS